MEQESKSVFEVQLPDWTEFTLNLPEREMVRGGRMEDLSDVEKLLFQSGAATVNIGHAKYSLSKGSPASYEHPEFGPCLIYHYVCINRDEAFDRYEADEMDDQQPS